MPLGSVSGEQVVLWGQEWKDTGALIGPGRELNLGK